jgi:hypothetical protein
VKHRVNQARSMSLMNPFDAAANGLQESRDADSGLDALENRETARLLDDLLGRHEDDDFPAASEADLLVALEE